MNDEVTWDTRPLKTRIADRGADCPQFQGLEEVVLAYARWQGRTGEPDIDQAAEKRTLDRMLDVLEAERWGGLKEMVGEVDDRLLLEVMRYAGTRGMEQGWEMLRELEREGEREFPDRERAVRRKRRKRTRSR